MKQERHRERDEAKEQNEENRAKRGEKSKTRRKGASEIRRDWHRAIAHDESGHIGD